MASRVPFVTSTSGALLEVSGAHYAYQVPPGDSLQLANVIEALDSAHNDLTADFEKLLDANYERWAELFSPQAGKKRLAKICETLGIR
jgi:glycosyltransferase involved in cell wall biosynthesis